MSNINHCGSKLKENVGMKIAKELKKGISTKW